MAKSKVKAKLIENAGTQVSVKNEATKPAKSKAWIQYPIIAVVAIAVGVGAGVFVKRKFGQEQIDYSNFDATAFSADSKELLKRYEANPKASFTSAELVNIGLEKYRQAENSYSYTVGTAKTIVSQTIRNAQIKNGDKYFEEQISRSSMVSLANRLEQTANEDKVTVYKGSATGDETASYSGETTEYNLEGFKNFLGRTLDEMFIYTISDDTAFDDSKTETLSNGNIKVYVDIDPEIATYYYKIQMKNMSNLDSLPTFEYVRLTYTFKSDMTLLHCHTDEKYQVSMGMTVSITNTLNTYYHANEYLKIPELNESFDYSTEGEQDYE